MNFSSFLSFLHKIIIFSLRNNFRSPFFFIQSSCDFLFEKLIISINIILCSKFDQQRRISSGRDAILLSGNILNDRNGLKNVSKNGEVILSVTDIFKTAPTESGEQKIGLNSAPTRGLSAEALLQQVLVEEIGSEFDASEIFEPQSSESGSTVFSGETSSGCFFVSKNIEVSSAEFSFFSQICVTSHDSDFSGGDWQGPVEIFESLVIGVLFQSQRGS